MFVRSERLEEENNELNHKVSCLSTQNSLLQLRNTSLEAQVRGFRTLQNEADQARDKLRKIGLLLSPANAAQAPMTPDPAENHDLHGVNDTQNQVKVDNGETTADISSWDNVIFPTGIVGNNQDLVNPSRNVGPPKISDSVSEPKQKIVVFKLRPEILRDLAIGKSISSSYQKRKRLENSTSTPPTTPLVKKVKTESFAGAGTVSEGQTFWNSL